MRPTLAISRYFALANARVGALLALLYGCGLRRAEVVAFDRRPCGARWVAPPPGGCARPAAVPGPQGRAHRAGPRMSTAAVWSRLQTLAKRAGVQQFSPHDLRRSFVGELLDAGADVVTVQALAGHANVQTTARYDRRGERAQRHRPAARPLHALGALTAPLGTGAPAVDQLLDGPVRIEQPSSPLRTGQRWTARRLIPPGSGSPNRRGSGPAPARPLRKHPPVRDPRRVPPGPPTEEAPPTRGGSTSTPPARRLHRNPAPWKNSTAPSRLTGR